VPQSPRGRTVLIVDDSPENLRLLTTLVRRADLVPRPIPSVKLALEAAAQDPPDLILLDMLMPEMSGLDACRWLKRHPVLRSIPVVFISGLDGPDDKVEAFRAGGVDYVSRPFHEREVLARLLLHLSLGRVRAELEASIHALDLRLAEQLRQVTAAHLSTIHALARLAETRDDDTGQHIERVRTLTMTLASRMRDLHLHLDLLDDAYIEALYHTASLHDIGKVGIPDAVLLKPGPLSHEEFTVMSRHAELGAHTLGSVLARHPDNLFLRMGVDVARSHHERWDGTGYPDGLAAQAIPLAARIVAVADVYDALTSDRVYRPAMDPELAFRELIADRGTHFDPDVVDAFVSRFPEIRRIRQDLRDASGEGSHPPAS
jgi:putative two-component system response regulator